MHLTTALRLNETDSKPIIALIGAGGIMSGEDAAGRVRSGASLVQLYTGFIYCGPALIGEAQAQPLEPAAPPAAE